MGGIFQRLVVGYGREEVGLTPKQKMAETLL